MYPILNYFHGVRPEDSVPLAILRLADAIFLIQGADDHDEMPPPTFFRRARRTFERYTGLKQTKLAVGFVDVGEASEKHLTGRSLESVGILAQSDETFRKNLKDYRPLRNRLVQLCREDGWQPTELDQDF